MTKKNAAHHAWRTCVRKSLLCTSSKRSILIVAVCQVTGAAGFVGTHVVLEALQAGYRVRGSVRRQTQVEKLKQFFGPKSSAEFVIVPDITKPDAYDGVLDGVSFVCHVASPLPSQVRLLT